MGSALYKSMLANAPITCHEFSFLWLPGLKLLGGPTRNEEITNLSVFNPCSVVHAAFSFGTLLQPGLDES